MLVLNIFGKSMRKDALCATCSYAHVEKGFRGEVLTFCNFAYPMRCVCFDVCECTDYNDRRAAKPAKVAGFVKSIVDEVETA